MPCTTLLYSCFCGFIFIIFPLRIWADISHITQHSNLQKINFKDFTSYHTQRNIAQKAIVSTHSLISQKILDSTIPYSIALLNKNNMGYDTMMTDSTMQRKNRVSNSLKQNDSDLQLYIQKALELELYKKREWLILMHSNGKKSEITDSNFFYAKNGRISTKDEMIATITAFYQPTSEVVIPKQLQERIQKAQKQDNHNSKLPKSSLLPQDYHAICRFPARFAFLNTFLHFKNLPNISCDEYKAMLEYVNPKSATIVFPAAHINSPASMFGHTFILLQSNYKSKLLSFAINYAANADGTRENLFSFAIKGLFGGYKGIYSILPYYDKLKEYRDTESRDIWEIGLNLNEEEVKRMFAHLWEVRNLELPYLFFTQNCSYNILWLIEAARPSVNLRQYFIYQVNPPETLFAMQKENLITTQTYRPSKRTIINAYNDNLSLSAINKVKKIALGKLSPNTIRTQNIPLQDKQFILEASNELAEYNYIHRKLTWQQYTAIAHNIALNRSTLGKSPEIRIFTPKPILQGNQGGRISTFSLFKNNQAFFGIEFRLTYHDITDNDVGYLKGSQIEFLKGSLYLDFMQDSYKKIQIHEIKFLSIESYGLFNQIFHPISFRFNMGFDRSFLIDSPAYYMSLGGGLSYGLKSYGFIYYLLEPLFFVQNGANVALANVFGINLTDNNRLKLAIEYQNRIYGRVNANQIYATLSINLVRNLALFGRYEHYFYTLLEDRFVGMAGLRVYF